MSAPAADRPLRRDAEQNRQRLLDAAADVFAEHGLEASVEEIARTAGVGMGTLYRRFPTKDALISALVQDVLTTMLGIAKEGTERPDGTGLEYFLEAASAYQAAHRGCLQRLWNAGTGHELVQEVRRLIDAMLADAKDGPPMLDLVGTAIGAVPPGRTPVDGSRVSPGDVVLALPSSGLHSNGYSLARQALFEAAGLTLADQVPATGQRLVDALLAPTRIYVRAAEALWEAGVDPRGLVHISGGGLLNLARLAADVSYELDALPPPLPVFALIAESGAIPPATMYATFNMGTGFCVVLSPSEVETAIDALESSGEEPVRIGIVTDRPGRTVTLPTAALTGRGDTFHAIT